MKELLEDEEENKKKLEEDKNILVSYKLNGKKVYYRLTEDVFLILLCQKS